MLEIREILNLKLGKKGFTLAELLVVVAILAVLVAVSIPIFTGRLEAAKKATDEANMRAAKAMVANKILTSENPKIFYLYDAQNSTLIEVVDKDDNYHKPTEKIDGYNQCVYNINFPGGSTTIEKNKGIICITALDSTNLSDLTMQWLTWEQLTQLIP